MSSGLSRSIPTTSKFIVIYTKLLEAIPPHQIAPLESEDQFFSNLLNLDVKVEYLRSELDRVSKDACLGKLKPLLSSLFRICIKYAYSTVYEDVKKAHALETLAIVLRCILAKSLTGWEVMETLGGGVRQSDEVFLALTTLVSKVLADERAPANIRHQVLQVALTYVCAIGQLSPGAYFLQQDLFPSIVSFTKSPDTEQFALEAVLLLAILANFHRSDAEKLNPYLKCIGDTRDIDFMRKICNATSVALTTAIGAYQKISDDSAKPTFPMNLSLMITSLRPDRVFAPRTTNTSRELFKNQPIEVTVILLPVFEFLRANPVFPNVILEYIVPNTVMTTRIQPPPFTILSISSYILTHASSTPSSRSIGYANLSLNVLHVFAENAEIMHTFCQPTEVAIPVCRQRLPHLPLPQPNRPPVSALLDCCILWLRHNLHRRLEVYCFMNCIRVCYRIVWFLQSGHIRIEYEWREMWDAILGLLNFLATKNESLDTTGGVEQIIREAVVFLNLCLLKSEAFLPSAEVLHEFIYELTRCSMILKKQVLLLKTLTIPQTDPRHAAWTKRSTDALDSVLAIVDFYEKKVNEAGVHTAKAVMTVVAKAIEEDGLYVGGGRQEEVQVLDQVEDILGFARYGCADGLALMP